MASNGVMAYVVTEEEAAKILREVKKRLVYIRVPSIWEDEKESVALVGLAKAFRDWKDSHGASFISYAMKKIEGEVKRFLRNYQSIVKPSWKAEPPKTLRLSVLKRRHTYPEVEGLPERSKMLTRRQKDVLILTAQGLNKPQIAETMGIKDIRFVRRLRQDAQKRLGYKLTEYHYGVVREVLGTTVKKPLRIDQGLPEPSVNLTS